MKIRRIGGILAFLVFCLFVTDLQARLAVALQQKDGVVSIVKRDGKMMTGDFETFVLAGDEVVAKASNLQGQKAHILYYVTNEDKICVDLRPAGEPPFKIPEHPKRGNRPDGKQLY